MQETIYDRVLRLANGKGIAISALEADCELSNGSIKKWGVSSPSVDKLGKVADYFNVSLDYLRGATPYKNQYEEWNAKYNKNESMKNKVKAIEAADTLAAHLEDKEITDEKIKALTQYADLLFDKKK